jgi:hypothetical protein
MICSRNREDVRHRAAMTATRLAESKRTAGPRAVGVTRAKAPVTASCTRSAGDLKRNENAVPDAPFADLVADGDHLGHRLVSNGERPGEEPERRHRVVEITARNGKRPHERAPRVTEHRLRSFLPSDPSGFKEYELTHRRSA